MKFHLKVLVCVSYELRMKYIWKSWPLRYFTHNYIWISYEVHMNFTWNTYVAETFYSYELHKNFIRTSYEFRRKYTRIIRWFLMKFIWSSYEIISYEYGHLISYELHEKLPDNSCIFPTKFVRSSYEVLVKFIWIESFCYICILSEVHVNFIWNSYVIMCEISKWPWFSYVFHSKFIWHTDQNFQMKFHTNDTNRPS